MLGLANITYYYSIIDLMNKRKISYDNWSFVISVGLGYLSNNLVPTKFVIDITRLFLYRVILNHPVIGLIILTALPFVLILNVHFLVSRAGYSQSFNSENLRFA